MEVFEMISEYVWKTLSLSKKFNILQGEETVSDSILLKLAIAGDTSLSIIKTPKNIEKIKGTDWEWWIGCRSTGWVRIAAQAKKIDKNGRHYSAFKHKVGKTGIYQHKILEAYSKRKTAYPIYVFYNHTNLVDPKKHWHCNKNEFQEDLLGISFTNYYNIKAKFTTRGGKDFESLHSNKFMFPLKCLMSCITISRRRVPLASQTPPSKNGTLQLMVSSNFLSYASKQNYVNFLSLHGESLENFTYFKGEDIKEKILNSDGEFNPSLKHTDQFINCPSRIVIIDIEDKLMASNS
ncbi:hypothetical protein QNH99_04260 [Pantoea allii]|uniref:DUF6615 family protein n=1 Tax=Pantoea allii TaxID=574096 RepID=UPI0024B67C6F|nr:DUF6615 family protein [Pantoea allii]MDJ0036644.1 hypothetical protein [Pantoea allii]